MVDMGKSRKKYRTRLVADAEGGLRAVRKPWNGVEEYNELRWHSADNVAACWLAPLSFSEFADRLGLGTVNISDLATITQQLALDDRLRYAESAFPHSVADEFKRRLEEHERWSNVLAGSGAVGELQRYLNELEERRGVTLQEYPGETLQSSAAGALYSISNLASASNLSDAERLAGGEKRASESFESLARGASLESQSGLARGLSEHDMLSRGALSEKSIGSYSQIMTNLDKIKDEFDEGLGPAVPTPPLPLPDFRNPYEEEARRREESDKRRDEFLSSLLNENKKVVRKLGEGEVASDRRDRINRRWILATFGVSVLAFLATVLSHELVVEYLRTVIPSFQEPHALDDELSLVLSTAGYFKTP